VDENDPFNYTHHGLGFQKVLNLTYVPYNIYPHYLSRKTKDWYLIIILIDLIINCM